MIPSLALIFMQVLSLSSLQMKPAEQENEGVSSVPVSLFQSGQFLSITEDSPGGLILLKDFYADFAGSGAAVGGTFDIQCQFVYVAGVVRFNVPETYEDRQTAFKNRINYIKKLEQIALEPSSPHRSRLMKLQLAEWVGLEEAKKIPTELIAKLAGLHPVQKRWRSQ